MDDGIRQSEASGYDGRPAPSVSEARCRQAVADTSLRYFMSVNEKQTFINALNGGMVGKYYPTQLDDTVLDPLKKVIKKDLNDIFSTTLLQQQVVPSSAGSGLVNAGHTDESRGSLPARYVPPHLKWKCGDREQ